MRDTTQCGRWLAVLAVVGWLAAGCSGGPDDGDAASVEGAFPACTATCESLGQQCGEVCGHSCGVCGTNAEGTLLDCVAGRCECLPNCHGRGCSEPDGCGGTCGPCSEDLSCEACALRLVRLDQTDFAGRIAAVTLGIEYTGGPPPRIASLRIDSDGGMRVDGVELGPALRDSGKRLYRYTNTRELVHRLEDGSHQIRILSGEAHLDAAPGRWLTLRFTRAVDEDTPAEPVSFWLVRGEKILAPGDADANLQRSEYERPIVVMPGAAGEGVDAP